MKRLGEWNEKETKRLSWEDFPKIYYFFIGIGILLLIVLYVREFRFFNLTLNPKPLVFSFLLIGALVGALVGKRLSGTGEDLTERIQIIIFFVVLCGLFSPLFGSLINRIFSFGPPQREVVEFVQEAPFYSSLFGFIKGEKVEPTGYHLFFYRKGSLKRITLPRSRFADKSRGDTIQLSVKYGLFRVPYIVPPAN